METFSAAAFYWIARNLELTASVVGFKDDPIPEDKRQEHVKTFLRVASDCTRLGLTLSMMYAVEIAAKCKKEITGKALREDILVLQNRISDEIGLALFLHVPSSDTAYYEQQNPLFPEIVTTKIPKVGEDLSEAGKCYALSRYTAAVFHLMRAMEIAVQKFGHRLGVSFANQKNWQNILDETNKAIKAKNQKQKRTKQYAAISAHLYSVKLAWRNEVMHPKATYTPTQDAHPRKSDAAFHHTAAPVQPVRRPLRHLVAYGSTNKYRPVSRSRASGSPAKRPTQPVYLPLLTATPLMMKPTVKAMDSQRWVCRTQLLQFNGTSSLEPPEATRRAFQRRRAWYIPRPAAASLRTS